MINLTEYQKNILTHLQRGGLIAYAIHGRKTIAVEILSRPKCEDAGLKRIEIMLKEGLIREGDRSPYKTGIVTPVVLTEDGKNALIRENTQCQNMNQNIHSSR